MKKVNWKTPLLYSGLVGIAAINGCAPSTPTNSIAYRTNTLSLTSSQVERKLPAYSTQELLIDNSPYRVLPLPDTATVKTMGGETLERKVIAGVKLIPKENSIETLDGNVVQIESEEEYFPVKITISGDAQSINKANNPKNARVKYFEKTLEEDVKPDQYGLTISTTLKETVSKLSKVALRDTANPRNPDKRYITMPFDTKLPQSLPIIYISEDAKHQARIVRKGKTAKLELFLESNDLYVPIKGSETLIPSQMPVPTPTPRATLVDPHPPQAPTSQSRNIAPAQTPQYRVFTIKSGKITDDLNLLPNQNQTIEIITEFGPISVEIEPECNN